MAGAFESSSHSVAGVAYGLIRFLFFSPATYEVTGVMMISALPTTESIRGYSGQLSLCFQFHLISLRFICFCNSPGLQQEPPESCRSN